MLKKILILILPILTIISCESYGPDKRVSSQNFDQKESSIVIARMEYGAHFGWRNDVDKNIWYMGTKNNWTQESGIRYESYFVNPGYYYLDRIRFPYPPTTREAAFARGNATLETHHFDEIIVGIFDSNSLHFSGDGWNKKLKAPNFASFETKTNEIVYIGDLIFTVTKNRYWIRGKINLTVEDHFEEAKQYFYEKFPEYRNKKIVKRLTKPGALLSKENVGTFW